MMSVDRGLDGLDGGGRCGFSAASRRRGRRLRMHWRHVLSIRMAVAALQFSATVSSAH